jgi:hypothetical protein
VKVYTLLVGSESSGRPCAASRRSPAASTSAQSDFDSSITTREP